MSGEHVPGYYEAPQPLEMPHGRGGGGYRPLSPEERAARDENRRAAMRESVNTHFAALAEELAQEKSDRLQRFLTCSANMIRLSAANQELVFSQMPDATFVATYPTWTRDYNRYPEGRASIYIRQPKPFVITESAEAEEMDTAQPDAAPARQPGEKGKAGVSFHPLAVWDVSQTKQMEDKPVKPLPVFFTPLAGPDGMGELNDRLQQAMEAEGITVGETIYTEGAEGYNLPNVVMTREGLALTNKALVRIHEWTHNLLHRTEEARSFPRGKKECHAEAVAYVVMRHLTGFASPFTADYLAHYNNDPAKLRAEIEPILTAAQHIIGSLQKLEPTAAQPHGATEPEANPAVAQVEAAAPEIIPYDLWGEEFAQGVSERLLKPPRKQQEGQAE